METKYNIRDYVWIMFDNKPQHKRISEIKINISGSIVYRFDNIGTVDDGVWANGREESKLFQTLEDLLNSFIIED